MHAVRWVQCVLFSSTSSHLFFRRFVGGLPIGWHWLDGWKGPFCPVCWRSYRKFHYWWYERLRPHALVVCRWAGTTHYWFWLSVLHCFLVLSCTYFHWLLDGCGCCYENWWLLWKGFLHVRSRWPMRLPVVWELVSCCPVFVWCSVWRWCIICFLLGFHSLGAEATCCARAHVRSLHFWVSVVCCPGIGRSDVFLCNISRSGFPNYMS